MDRHRDRLCQTGCITTRRSRSLKSASTSRPAASNHVAIECDVTVNYSAQRELSVSSLAGFDPKVLPLIKVV